MAMLLNEVWATQDVAICIPKGQAHGVSHSPAGYNVWEDAVGHAG